MKILPALTRAMANRAVMVGVLIVAAGIGVLGIQLLARDRSELQRESRLRSEDAAIETKLVDVQDRTESIRSQIPAQQERVARAEKIIGQLEGLQSTWDMLVGNRAQQRANAERMKQMQALHADAVAQVADLQQQLARANWERENLEIERTRIGSQLRIEEAKKAGGVYPLRRAWLSVRGWLCLAVALTLFGFVAWLVATRQWRLKKGVVIGGSEF
jgi:hypothetical protein